VSRFLIALADENESKSATKRKTPESLIAQAAGGPQLNL
jgi:hypothetical protein